MLTYLVSVKPSQQSGTLPSLPDNKSFLRRDAISRAQISPQNRLVLLEILAGLLEDEYQLAKDSSNYTRTSFTSTSTSKPPSFDTSNSFVSTRSSSSKSYVTAYERQETITASKDHRMAKNVKKDFTVSNDIVKPSAPKKREAPQPAQTV